MLKSLKKNQIIIYVIALMLVAAGYLNYTADGNLIPTSSEPDAIYQENLANIGDATLVSSNFIEENQVEENTVQTNEAEEVNSEQNTTVVENTTDTAAIAQNTDEYFVKSKLERETMYSQMLETYQNIVNSNTVSEEQRNIATQEIANINKTKNGIMICENLLGTKGLENNVVFVNGNSISVVVKVEGELSGDQVAQIQNVVSREMSAEISNINITQK